MESSFFIDRDHAPDSNALSDAIGKNYQLWSELERYVLELCPSALEEWNFSKSGWNCRIRDKKRVIIYLMPGNRYFRASLVLGRKAITDSLVSNLTDETKTTITNARLYAEGAGIRIDVKNKKALADIKMLVAIKLKY